MGIANPNLAAANDDRTISRAQVTAQLAEIGVTWDQFTKLPAEQRIAALHATAAAMAACRESNVTFAVLQRNVAVSPDGQLTVEPAGGAS